jgi:carboxylesterase
VSRDFRFLHRVGTRAVLLLHGMTGSPSELAYLGRALFRAGYDVYCPVLPGHVATLQDLKRSRWQDWYGFSLDQYDRLRKQYDEVFVAGLCLGATLGAALAQERSDVSGLALMAPLVRIDGWGTPWYRFLLPLVICTPLKFFHVFLEKGSMGVKNDQVRERMKAAFVAGGDALDCFPAMSVLELQRFSDFVLRRLHRITAPLALFHSEEDDFAAIGAAEAIFAGARSTRKELVRLRDSYHLLPIDNERDLVAQRTIAFFDEPISGRVREEGVREECAG